MLVSDCTAGHAGPTRAEDASGRIRVRGRGVQGLEGTWAKLIQGTGGFFDLASASRVLFLMEVPHGLGALLRPSAGFFRVLPG